MGKFGVQIGKYLCRNENREERKCTRLLNYAGKTICDIYETERKTLKHHKRQLRKFLRIIFSQRKTLKWRNANVVLTNSVNESPSKDS